MVTKDEVIKHADHGVHVAIEFGVERLKQFHFDETLIVKSGKVLYNLHSNVVVGFQVETFDNLPKGAFAQQIQYLIAIGRAWAGNDVMDVENVIMVLVIISLIVCALTRFGQDASGVGLFIVTIFVINSLKQAH